MTGVPSTGQLVSELVRAFPLVRQKLSSGELTETMNLYVRELEDIPPGVLAPVVRELIRTEEWFPPVSKIRRCASELVLQLPTETAALAQVEQRMRWNRLYDPTDPEAEPMPEMHGLVHQALDHVGGFHALRSSDNPERTRAQMLRYYCELREQAIREAAVGNPELEAGTPLRGLPRAI